MPAETFHALSVSEAITHLDSTEQGISNAETEKRRAEHGLNAIEKKGGISLGRILLAQFSSILVLLLLAAAVFSFLIGEHIDAAVILSIVFINAVIGFFQEYKAEKTIEAIQQHQSHHAVVLRDGTKQEIEVEQLVPGDVIQLSEGQRVPADARIISQTSLLVDESILTGESKSVSKKTSTIAKKASLADRINCVFSGTTVAAGTAKAVIFATGDETEFGKIASYVLNQERSLTPLQRTLNDLGQKLGLLSVAISLPIVALGLYRDVEMHQLILTAVALAVSAIPEGLPIAVTVALAVAIKRMSKRNVLVRRLSSVEALGSVNVICTDKTGTLTENKMQVEFELGSNKKQLYETMVFASTATESVGDPTEVALIVHATKHGLTTDAREQADLVAELPFNSDQKFMAQAFASSGKQKGKYISFLKGAPEKVLNFTTLSSSRKKELLAQTEKLSRQGKRVLAFARKNHSKKPSYKDPFSRYTFDGLVGLQDPPRRGVKSAIKKCSKAGVRTIMITGDHPGTARAIAEQVGITTKHLAIGKDIDHMSDEELVKTAQKTNVFARVSPEHKLKLLKALQSTGSFVAMTGDGVNDAPALRQADIGIAVASGSDLAKDASDLVLLDNNFVSIVAAIEEGRGIFSNMKKFITFLLSVNFSSAILIFSSFLFGLPLPLLPIHLLWLNVVTDSFPSLALSVDPYPDDLLSRKPYNPTKEILSGLLTIAVFAGTINVIATGTTFLLELFVFESSLMMAQTMTFTVTVLFELAIVFALRSTKRFKHSRPLQNRWLLLAVGISALLQLSVIYLPFARPIFSTSFLTWDKWLVILPMMLTGFIGFELRKLLQQRNN